MSEHDVTVTPYTLNTLPAWKVFRGEQYIGAFTAGTRTPAEVKRVAMTYAATHLGLDAAKALRWRGQDAVLAAPRPLPPPRAPKASPRPRARATKVARALDAFLSVYQN